MPEDELFRAADRDGDGFLTLEEHLCYTRRLTELDADDDGVVSREEVGAGLAKMNGRPASEWRQHFTRFMARSFDIYDLDGNGLVSVREEDEIFTFLFRAKDTDGDGKLSLEELSSLASTPP